MSNNNHSITNKSPNNTQPPTDRLLRWPSVEPSVGICRSYAHQLIAEGKFPAPIKLVEGGRASAWLESEVNAWIAQRVKASRPTEPETAQGVK